MNITETIIPIFDWKLIIFSSVTEKDIDSIVTNCNKYGVPELQVKEVLTHIIGIPNNGIHLGSSVSKISFLFYSPINSELNFWKMVPHEIDHLISCIQNSLNLDNETGAYLTGFVYSMLYQLNLFENIKSDYVDKAVYPNGEFMKQFLINVGDIKPDKLQELHEDTDTVVDTENTD